MLDHAIVVATRNRLGMLAESMPRFLDQSRPAARVVVVDRSDDHEAVRALCERLAARSTVPVEVHYGEQANLPAQRNQGLAHVREAVVMYPDDDSIWYPDTAERVMAVFEADVAGRYGAVSARPVPQPPGEPTETLPQPVRRFGTIPVVMRLRNAVESVVLPQPFNVYGEERIRALRPVADADGLPFPLIPTIAGYRMSFRTEAARSLQFDETLGSRIGYATHEDKDMGLRVLQSGLLMAAADDARVFHHVAPGARAGGFAYGFFHILNYLYSAAKVFPAGSRALRVTRPYLRGKVFLYALRRRDQYARDVARGARAAFAQYDWLLEAAPDGLADRYAQICDRHAQ